MDPLAGISLRFLAPGSRLLLNGSQTEDFTEDNRMLSGYQTTSGEWIVQMPRVQLLKSPLEQPQVRQESKEGSSEIGDYAGTMQQFRHRLV